MCCWGAKTFASGSPDRVAFHVSERTGDGHSRYSARSREKKARPANRASEFLRIVGVIAHRTHNAESALHVASRTFSDFIGLAVSYHGVCRSATYGGSEGKQAESYAYLF